MGGQGYMQTLAHDQISIKLNRVGYLQAQLITSREGFEAIEIGVQKSEERRKSLSEIEKEVKASLVETVFAEVRRNIEVEVKREIQENDDLKVLRATLQLFQEEMNKDEKVEENPVFQNGIQKSEERRKSLSEIEKEVKGILVENVFAEVRRSIKVEVKREIQENDDIKVLRATLQLFQEEKHKDEKVEENPVFQEVMRRICVLEQHSMRRCTVHSETQVAKSSGDDERGVNESVNSLLKSSTDKIVPVAENLENRKKELEPKVKRLETKANGMKTLHDLKEEIGVRDRLSKVVTRFANRLPVMVGVLGVLFTITFPCKLRKVFSWLIGFSLMGLLVMAGLAAFHFWEISKDIDVLKTVHEKLNSPRKNDLANGDMDLERGEKLKPEKKNDKANGDMDLERGEKLKPEKKNDKANGDMDLERGEKLKPEKKNDKANGDIDLDRGEKFQFGTFWSYAWRHVVDRGEKLKPEKKNDKTNGDMDLERGEKLKPEKKNDKANGDMDLARGEKLKPEKKNDKANGDMDLERGEKLKPEKKNDKANGDMDLERGEKLKPEKKNDKANGDIDLDRGEKFQFGTFWSYAWRHVVDRGEKLKPEKKNDKTNGDMDLERGEKLKPEKKNDKANGDMDLARGEKLKPEKKNDKANGDMDLERGEKLKPEKKNDKANGDIDLDRGEKFQFGTFWSYAWPHVVDTFFLLLLALGFVISVGVFIYSEKCVEVDPLAPAPSPAVPSPFLS